MEETKNTSGAIETKQPETESKKGLKSKKMKVILAVVSAIILIPVIFFIIFF